MCLLCDIVHRKITDETEFFRDGLMVMVMWEEKGYPLCIWHDHEADPLPILKERMRATARAQKPGFKIVDTKMFGPDHYHFYMRPDKSKT